MTSRREIQIAEHHVISAVESYLRSMAMIDDTDDVVDVAKDRRSGNFIIKMEKNID